MNIKMKQDFKTLHQNVLKCLLKMPSEAASLIH